MFQLQRYLIHIEDIWRSVWFYSCVCHSCENELITFIIKKLSQKYFEIISSNFGASLKSSETFKSFAVWNELQILWLNLWEISFCLNIKTLLSAKTRIL